MAKTIPVPADLDTAWLADNENAGRPFRDARDVIEAAARVIEKQVGA